MIRKGQVRWLPKEDLQRGRDAGVAAVAVAPPANRADLHSFRVVSYSQATGGEYALGVGTNRMRKGKIRDPRRGSCDDLGLTS
jgi:hypothetical protein